MDSKNTPIITILNFGIALIFFSWFAKKIFWENLQYFSMFVAAERYFGDIPDIQELQATFGCFKTSKISEKAAERWHFGENSEIFATFPGKKYI